MKREDFWRTFALNRELHVAGAFIYDGIQDLRLLESFDYSDEVFQFAYHLAVGFERLLKIAVVLLEFTDQIDPTEFEKSLITHNHSVMLQRVKALTSIKLKSEDNELLDILGKFYKSYRYDNFSLSSVSAESSLTRTLVNYFDKRIPDFRGGDEVLGEAPACSDAIRYFTGGVCRRIASQLYTAITDAARQHSLYTYELRCDSKAFKVFMLDELHFGKEELLWKELGKR